MNTICDENCIQIQTEEKAPTSTGTTNNEPIITFSPARSRYDPGGQRNHHRSLNSALSASDFDLNLDLHHKTAVNHSSKPTFTPSTSMLPSENHDYDDFSPNNYQCSPHPSSDIINKDFNFNGEPITIMKGVTPGSSNAELMFSNPEKSGSSNTMELGASTAPTPIRTTLQLQKKLEKKIAQASAIAAAMNSMSNSHTLHSPLESPKVETEFGDWNSSGNNNSSSNVPTSTECNVPKQSTSTTSPSLELSNANLPTCGGETARKTKGGWNPTNSSKAKAKGGISSSNTTRPSCVKYHEDEVEIISKSSRVRVSGGLIPPERLAIPNKQPGNNRRKSKSKKVISKEAEGTKEEGESGENQQLVTMGTDGITSEVKPLVEWDSDDESQEELSFFPANKVRAKLSDNLSLSLSGEEDDLHLSPPIPTQQKCPCDPRKWINEHFEFPKASGSFRGNNNDARQCLIC